MKIYLLLLFFAVNLNDSFAVEASNSDTKLKQVEELEKSLANLKNDIKMETEREELKREIKEEIKEEFKAKTKKGNTWDNKKASNSNSKAIPVFKKETKAEKFAKTKVYFTVGYFTSNYLNTTRNNLIYDISFNNTVNGEFLLAKKGFGFEMGFGVKLNDSLKNRFFLEFAYESTYLNSMENINRQPFERTELFLFTHKVNLFLNYERAIGKLFYIPFGLGFGYQNSFVTDIIYYNSYKKNYHSILFSPRVGLGLRLGGSFAIEFLVSYNKYIPINHSRDFDSVDSIFRIKLAF